MMTVEERKRAILTLLAERPCSCNEIAHTVWRDWKGPSGNGSHPLTRVTGKIMHALKRQSFVCEKWNDAPKYGKVLWHITTAGKATL